MAVNIAALVAANTSPTGSIDPAKIKARFPEWELAQTTRSLPTLVNLQARILEKQESVQERKAKRKVTLPSLSCTLNKHFIG